MVILVQKHIKQPTFVAKNVYQNSHIRLYFKYYSDLLCQRDFIRTKYHKNKGLSRVQWICPYIRKRYEEASHSAWGQ